MANSEDKAQELFDVAVAERLPSLDRLLARMEVKLRERPLLATLEFIDIWVLEVNDGKGRQYKPELSTDITNIVRQSWFAALYQAIKRWYQGRYGEAFSVTSPRTLKGFVTIWASAFELAVPATVVEPAVPGESVWLRWPGWILEKEDPLAWLISPPSLRQLTQS